MKKILKTATDFELIRAYLFHRERENVKQCAELIQELKNRGIHI